MTLNVETGTGSDVSESYISVSDADLYHSNRGNAAWGALDDAAKEQALRKATDYMQQTYRMRWEGARKNDTQALDWPRYYVPRTDAITSAYVGRGGYSPVSYYPSDSVPKEVRNACAELALRSLDDDLLADLEPGVASETVGPIAVTYRQGENRHKTYSAVDRLLTPLLKGFGEIALVRS